VCLDRQHGGIAGRLCGGAGSARRGDRAEGKIATGKLAQALMHGAALIALRGNFDEALRLVRKLCEATRSPWSSVNEFRIEGQKTAAFEVLEELDTIDALCIPVGNAGNITAVLAWLSGDGRGPAHVRLPGAARRRSSTVTRSEPRDGRLGDPHRIRALGAGDGRDDASAAGAGRERQQILSAWRCSPPGGRLCEPASAASVPAC